MSDIGELNCPLTANVGSRSTRVDPNCSANLQISLETDGNGGTSSGYFVTGLVPSTIQLRDVGSGSECTWRAWRSSPGSQRDGHGVVRESGHGVQERSSGCREMVTHKHGFESWRKLSKEYGSTTGTSLHEYTNLLENDFGTTDGFKKQLLKWEKQIVDFQNSTCCRGLQDQSGRI